MEQHNSPAFQFYPKDWLSDMNVLSMPRETEGDYIRLLCICWLEGFIPNNVEDIKSLLKPGTGHPLIGYDHLEPDEPQIQTLMDCFIENPDNPNQLIHPRLEKERVKQIKWSEKSSIGGKASAKAKVEAKEKGGSRVVEPNGNTSSSSSSSSSTKDLNPLSGKPDLEDFERLWKRYKGEPIGKKLARGYFNANIKNQEDMADYDKAEQNYYAIMEASFEGRSLKGGKTWFNNWRDYIDHEPPKVETLDPRDDPLDPLYEPGRNGDSNDQPTPF